MENHRFVSNILPTLQDDGYNAVSDYRQLLVLTLEEAVQNISDLAPHVMSYVSIAKEKCNRNSTLLTWDESAAIYFYTMPKELPSCSFNVVLRAGNRQMLRPWLAFLKLLTTALEKLTPTKTIIWRGVDHDATLHFVDNNVYTWWGVTSCSRNINSVQNFLGESGTLFAVETEHGRDVSMYSAIPDEAEVIIMPGTRIRAKSQSLDFIGRLFVIHLEEINPHRQIESNCLFDQIKEEYQQNSRIERFMNPVFSFPIEQSYINLSIVETKEQREKEKQLQNAQHAVVVTDAYEDIYGVKTAVDVKDIFKTCKNHVKQVLVFGRAGIGKSTFCRYIAYQWAIGSYWPQYELLALIPLRRLTVHRYPPNRSYSLMDLVKKEVFPLDLTDKAEEQLKKQFDVNKILWILDGYDEIIQNIPPHLQTLLEQLLKTPHHIITSRPYLNTLYYNVQMEIIGFTDKNIQNYVQNFFNLMKDELDETPLKTEKLLNYLRSNPSIWGVAHIPVNLELICSLWSNADWSETKQLTMTRLYTMMTEWIFRRHLTAQGTTIQKISTSQIYRRCQKEMEFLESLAFRAMESKTILIQPVLLEEASDETKISLEDYSHILNMGILKSLDKQGIGTQIETDKDHYFVHLSFQEYFAARYLINALKGTEIEKTIKFIRYHKYNQRYTLLFSFTAGLLSEKDGKSCLDLFWDTLLGTPVDLVGIRHMQLVIICMEEISTTSICRRRSVLLEWIANCLRFSFNTKNKMIRNYLLQSLQRSPSIASDQVFISMLIECLQCHDVQSKAEVLLFIPELNISTPSITLTRSIASRLYDEDEKIREYACYALGRIGEKVATNELIDELMRALDDKSERVTANACEALGKIGEKTGTNEVLMKLISTLKNKSRLVRKYACGALGKIGEKTATNEVISKLVSTLEDQNEYIRASACETLGKIGEKAGTNEVISKLVSVLEDQSEFVRASACDALGKIGEKTATDEVISKLVNALKDDREYVRVSVCDGLRKIGEKTATNEMISKILSALEDRSQFVRASACDALGKLGGKAATNEVISKLVSTLEDESEFVRASACDVLGKIGEKAVTNEVINKLIIALEDHSELVKASACDALGKIGEKAATDMVISKLVIVLNDYREFVRASACDALGKISEKAATDEVISKLANKLADESEFVRASACDALGKIGEKAATSEVVNKLVIVLKHQSKFVRVSACDALGKIGEKTVTDGMASELMSALEDYSEFVRASACEALGKIGEKTATDGIVRKLVSVLKDESEFVRASACDALGKLGEKTATDEVISKLVSALEDPSERVRPSACDALGKMGEKAATNEVISKLVSTVNSGQFEFYEFARVFGNIISSSLTLKQLDPKVITELFLCGDAPKCLKNVLENDLINTFLRTKNLDWLSAVIQFAFQKGAAVIAIEDKVVVYGKEEPLELPITNPQLVEELLEAFTDQRRRFHLYL